MSFMAPLGPVEKLAARSEAVAESKSINKRLTVWKTALGVFLGIMLASAVLGAAYYLGIQVPHERAKHVAEARRLFDVEIHERGFDAVTGLTAAQLESQLKEEEPSSPCNVLTGEAFASCASFDDVSAQREFVSASRRVKATR